MQQSEQQSQDRVLRLSDYISRVSDVTQHYLNRMEDSLITTMPSCRYGPGYTLTGAGMTLTVAGGGVGGAGLAEAGLWEAEVAQGRQRVREEQDKARCLEAKHGREMAMMRAEVQTLQDQLNIARASGRDVAPASPDDLTLSSQLTTCKVAPADPAPLLTWTLCSHPPPIMYNSVAGALRRQLAIERQSCVHVKRSVDTVH